MAESRPAPLLDFALATFHTTLFFALLIFTGYVSGALANLLASLNTLIGLALYGLLWMTTWWTTRRARQGLNWNSLADSLVTSKLIVKSLVWGGLNGLLVFLVLFAFYLVTFVGLALLSDVARFAAQSLQALMTGVFQISAFSLLALVVGSAFALIIGGLVGLVLAVIDGITIALARRIWVTMQSPTESPNGT